MKRKVLFVTILLVSMLCFAEELKVGDYCDISLDTSFEQMSKIKGIYPLFPTQNAKGKFTYYVLEHNDRKFVIAEGTELYLKQVAVSNDRRVFVYYKIKVEDIKPNCFVYSKEPCDIM